MTTPQATPSPTIPGKSVMLAGREYEPPPLELSATALQAAAEAEKRSTWGKPEIEAATRAVARFWPSTPADPPPAPDPA